MVCRTHPGNPPRIQLETRNTQPVHASQKRKAIEPELRASFYQNPSKGKIKPEYSLKHVAVQFRTLKKAIFSLILRFMVN